MRKLIILFLALFVVTGCGSKKNSEGTNDNSTVPKESETFTSEFYVNFPKVKNLISYLKVASKDVKILSETKNKLVYCLYQDSVDVHDESILSIYNYAKLLEKDGYQMDILDGTISSSFKLKKDNYTLSITEISDGYISEWKKSYQEENKIDTQGMTTENLVCEVINEE